MLGANYVTPNVTQMQELMDNTTHQVVTVNSISGVKFTSKTNSNYIFMPFAGYCYDGAQHHMRHYIHNWLADINSSKVYFANALYAKDSEDPTINDYNYYRCNGLTIRPIFVK